MGMSAIELGQSTARRGDTGQVATHTFSNPGSYAAHLLVISDGGCRDSLDTTIFVASNPVAAFMHSLNIGEAPLEIHFTNASSGAVNYSWDFGNATFSNSENPTVIYSDTGHYFQSLVATSFEGCTDTAYSDAFVLVPQLDLALTDLMLSNSGSLYTIGIRLANHSNVPVFGFTMKADFGGDARLLETRKDTLLPGVEKTFYFNGLYEYNEVLGDAFFCAEVALLNGLVETDLANNKQCRLLGGDFFVSEPYPNPAANLVTIGVILPEAGEVELTINDLLGRSVYHAVHSDAASGLNAWSIDLTGLRIGLYTCRATYQERTLVKRFLKKG
jgi:PKD repeat protein